MKRNWNAGKMGFIVIVVGLMIVLTACGKQAASTDSASSASPNEQAQGATNSAAPQNPVMSQKELELSMLFRGFLQMDNKGELEISKDQAGIMLPIVKKSTDDGEITADNQQKLMALLTPEQKKFIDDMTARFKQFTGNRSNPDGTGISGNSGKRPALTAEQRAAFQKNQPKLTDEERKKLQANRANGGQAGDQGNQAGQGNQGGQGNGGFGNFGANVEQQLLDLLDSKINN